MTIAIVLGAAQADADVCNALVPPVRGCNVGSGLHVVIPPDWQARAVAGQEVPGCNYAHLEQDGSLYVDERAQLRLASPQSVAALPPSQQTQAAALSVKLSSVITPSQLAQGKA